MPVAVPFLSRRRLVPMPAPGFAVPSTFLGRVRAAFSLLTRSAWPDGNSWPWSGVDPMGWTMVRGDNPTFYQATGRTVRMIGWERNPVVAACGRIIAEAAAPIEYEVYRKDSQNDTHAVPDSPAQQLLDNPMPGTPWSAFRHRAQTVLYRTIYGNGYWFAARAKNGDWFNERAPQGRLPVALPFIQPENLQYLWIDPRTLESERYQWRDRTGRTHISDVADIVHFRDLNANDTLFGFPRAAAAIEVMAGDNEATSYVREVLANHGVPGVVLKFPSGTADDDLDAAEARFKEKYASRGGRGGVAAIRDIETVETQAFNLRELEFPDLRAIMRESICAAFGVDPRMVGAASAKGQEAAFSGEQYYEARFRLFQQTCLPIIQAITDDLNAWLMPEFGEVLVRPKPQQLAAVMEDKAETSSRTLAQVQADVISVEEWREANGYDQTMAPSDTLLHGGNDVLVKDRLLELPTAMTLRETAPAEVPAQPTDPNAPKPGAQPAAAPAKDTPPQPRSRRMTRAQRATLTQHQRGVLWSDFDTRATKLETRYHREAVIQFGHERDQVMALFPVSAATRAEPDDAILAGILSQIAQFYGPGGQAQADWEQRFRKLYAETYAAGAEGLGIDFNLQNPAVQTAIRERARKLAEFVTDVSAQQITDVVAATRQAGLGMKDIAAAVDDTVFGGNAPVRAMAIARTESAGALNEGEYVTASQYGIFESKEWLTQGDDRVRDQHAMLDGTRIVMSGEFAPGLSHPGDQRAAADQVINCRCSLLYLTDPPEAA